MNPTETKEANAPSRLPVYLSALLIPGAGQFLQRRWLPALFFSITFLFLFGILTVQVTRVLRSFLQSMLAFMDGDSNRPCLQLNSASVLLPLGMSLIIYIIALCDTYLAYLRECRTWGKRRMEEKLKNLTPLVLALLLLTALPPTGTAYADSPAREPEGLMHQARVTNNLPDVNTLIEQCATSEVNTAVGGGVTPLHLAAALNQTNVIVKLVSAGADKEARTSAGFTPLHWAAGKDAGEATALLIQLGATVNTKATKGITPLHWAAGKNATHAVALLIAAGADVQSKTESGLTPLHWAVKHNAGEAAALLVSKIVSDQMEKEQAGSNRVVSAAIASASVSAAPQTPKETEPATAPPSRPVARKTLVVPIGLGEELTFVWIQDLKLWAGKYEITNGQYRRFKPKHNSLSRENVSLNGNDQPVVFVSWYDAEAFCNWLNKTFSDRLPMDCEFRLPMEAEWILMAKCGDNRKYPWGNEWPPKYGNYSDLTAKKNLKEWRGIEDYNDGYTVSCPVTESGSNEWAICGLAGNVWEWCDDWYDAAKKYKVRHGGSWDFDERPSLAILFRGFDRPIVRDDTVGFRIVVSPR